MGQSVLGTRILRCDNRQCDLSCDQKIYRRAVRRVEERRHHEPLIAAASISIPHALELSKMGYNAFALIYRPGWDTAMEDLGRALSFLYDHADELQEQIDKKRERLTALRNGARCAGIMEEFGIGLMKETSI